jgi:hypothetical protein
LFHQGGVAGADHFWREIGHAREAATNVSGVKRHQLVTQDHHRNLNVFFRRADAAVDAAVNKPPNCDAAINVHDSQVQAV